MMTETNQKIKDILIEVGFDLENYDLDETAAEIIDLVKPEPLGRAEISRHVGKTGTASPKAKGRAN